MIHEIALELDAELKAQGVPLPMIYGPERRESTTITRSRIVIERDRQNGDASLGPRSQQKNPRLANVRAIGVVLRVHAQSTIAGANIWDHERLADQAIDKVEIALRKVIHKRKTLWRITSAKLLDAEALAMLELEQWPGAVYELRFQVDRGVLDTTWAGDAAPVGDIGGITSTTQVTINGQGAPETACG